MKKLFLLLFVTAICGTVFAQDTNKSEMYRCTSVGISEVNTKTGVWPPLTYVDVNYIIHNNLTDQIFTINSKETLKIYIIDFVSRESKVDKDGDKYDIVTFKAYDDEGVRCNFIMFDYAEYSNINFLIEYKNMRIFFECSLI